MISRKSFLKWAGSKSRLMPELLRFLPGEGEVLREAFAGSASVFMNTNYEVYYLNDANPDLIQTFRSLAEDPEGFIASLRRVFIGANSLSAYKAYVVEYNKSQDSLERALIFNYLVRHSFNGLYRVNRKGVFNVPFGNYARVYFPEMEMMMFAEKVAKARTVHFSCLDYQEFLRLHLMEQGREGVLYLDPPYAATSKTSDFTSYTGVSFDDLHQRILHQYALMYSCSGHQVILSNSDTSFTRQLYSGQGLHSVQVRRSISCRGEDRKKVGELIVKYG